MGTGRQVSKRRQIIGLNKKHIVCTCKARAKEKVQERNMFSNGRTTAFFFLPRRTTCKQLLGFSLKMIFRTEFP